MPRHVEDTCIDGPPDSDPSRVAEFGAGQRVAQRQRDAATVTRELRCMRCGRPVHDSIDQYELFERMHYRCFHLEYEHGDADPNQPCDVPGCPIVQSNDPDVCQTAGEASHAGPQALDPTGCLIAATAKAGLSEVVLYEPAESG